MDFAEPDSELARGPIPLGPPNSMKVAIVTGIFGECISDHLLPFSDGEYFAGYRPETDGNSYIHRLGYDDLEVIVPPGRSSTAANGRFVYKRLQEMTSAISRDIIVVACSKDFYWSSTTSMYEPRYAWALYMRDGGGRCWI